MEQRPEKDGDTNERADARATIAGPNGDVVSEREPDEGAIQGGEGDPLGEGLADADDARKESS